MRLKNEHWNGKSSLGKSNRKGSKRETFLNEAKYQWICKDRRKHYVVLHEREQSKCTDMSRTRCRSSLGDFKTQKTLPAT